VRRAMLQGSLIVTASWVQSDALQLWDYRKGALLKNLPFGVKDRGHLANGSGDVLTQGAYLYCCQFCSSNVVVAAGTGTNSAQAIHLDSNEVRLMRSQRHSKYFFLTCFLHFLPVHFY